MSMFQVEPLCSCSFVGIPATPPPQDKTHSVEGYTKFTACATGHISLRLVDILDGRVEMAMDAFTANVCERPYATMRGA